MNEYLLRKLKEADIDPSNVIGFYWDGYHEDEGLVRCDISQMPRIYSYYYILIKCSNCGEEYTKRVNELTNTCYRCNYADKYQNMRTDYISVIKSAVQESNLTFLGYYLCDGLDGDFIESDIDNLPDLYCNDYVKFKCNVCGAIFNKRLNRLKENPTCPRCNQIAYGISQRLDWSSRLKDFEEEFNVTIIGRFDNDKIIDVTDVSELSGLVKSDFIRFKCNECGMIHDRGLYHLDYGCNHGLNSNGYKCGNIMTEYGLLSYSSSYELQFIDLLLDESRLTDIKSQPNYLVEYKHPDNSIHTYHPDFYIVFDDTEYIIEIKPESLVNDTINKLKITTAKNHFESMNMNYLVVTEKYLFNDDPKTSLINLLISNKRY